MRAVEQAKRDGSRLPGLGHRAHTVDPRVSVLFDLARDAGVSGDGIRFVRALEARRRRSDQAAAHQHRRRARRACCTICRFPPSAGKFIFIIGRVAGLTAEVAEEYAREKPMRVRIPVDLRRRGAARVRPGRESARKRTEHGRATDHGRGTADLRTTRSRAPARR